MSRTQPHEPLPVTIGKYHVEREIGRGASSVVYLAYDRFHGRKVAIKRIHEHLLSDAQQTARLRRRLHKEAQVVGQLNHPHIVRLFDVDEDASPPYLVLEYVEGRSLSAFTAPDTLLPVGQVLDLAFKCCGALEHAHRHGLVHRDIKPANLLMQPGGALKVADFGTALSLRGDETHVAGLVGSPLYMSPEQVHEQQCTHQSDMFSLAVVMYELLTARRPFDGGSDYATLYKISTESPPLVSEFRKDLPPGLDRVLERAMQKKAQDRFTDWAEFAAALLACSRSLPQHNVQDSEGECFASLRASPFFADFHDAAIWETLRLGQLKVFTRGAELMRENARGSSFCILLEGQVTVRREGVVISTLGPGVTLGEMTYLQPDNPVRTATVVAETDVVVFVIRNTALHQASDELKARFDKAFIKLLVDRLIATNAQVGSWYLLSDNTVA